MDSPEGETPESQTAFKTIEDVNILKIRNERITTIKREKHLNGRFQLQGRQKKS